MRKHSLSLQRIHVAKRRNAKAVEIIHHQACIGYFRTFFCVMSSILKYDLRPMMKIDMSFSTEKCQKKTSVTNISSHSIRKLAAPPLSSLGGGVRKHSPVTDVKLKVGHAHVMQESNQARDRRCRKIWTFKKILSARKRNIFPES